MGYSEQLLRTLLDKRPHTRNTVVVIASKPRGFLWHREECSALTQSVTLGKDSDPPLEHTKTTTQRSRPGEQWVKAH